MKLGDKVKFNKYMGMDYMRGQWMSHKVGDKTKRIPRRRTIVNRNNETTTYIEPIITDKVLEGTFVGAFKKKLKRVYKTYHEEENILLTELVQVGTDSLGVPIRIEVPRRRVSAMPSAWEIYRNRFRPSTNVRRIDNPRDLDKIAMINIKGKIVGVPMGNVIYCTYSNAYKVL